MVSVEKLASYSYVLIGIVFLLWGIGTIYFVMQVSTVLEAFGAVIAAAGIGVALPSFTTYIIVGWVFGILQTITGIITLMAGAASLVQK